MISRTVINPYQSWHSLFCSCNVINNYLIPAWFVQYVELTYSHTRVAVAKRIECVVVRCLVRTN